MGIASPAGERRGVQSADVVVVGGGAAGCVVAARLSEDPARRVLLVEAGPDVRAGPPDDVRDGRRPTTGHDWGYVETSPAGSPGRDLPRGKLLGGCSSTNGTLALRGHPADYDAWAAAGNGGWAFDDLLPYFRRLEHDADFAAAPEHGAHGPLPVRRYADDELTDVARAGAEGLASVGLPWVDDLNRPGAVGVGLLPTNCVAGTRVSTALAYLPPGQERPNLTLRCDTEVAAVEMAGARAVGVRLRSGEFVAADRTVICAGAYGSPLLLQRSGIGDARHLASLHIGIALDLPGVGENLVDHPAASVDLRYHGPVRDVPLLQVAATWHSAEDGAGDGGSGPPDIQGLVGGPLPYDDAGGVFFLAAALIKPRSRGWVRLASADPAHPPRIWLGYFREGQDLDRLVDGLLRVREATRSAPVARLCRAEELAPGAAVRDQDRGALRDWVRSATWTYHHPVGTCAMGPDPSNGAVVDPLGRVHGIDGLWVMDASVMPDIPSANTHIPTIMVAERMVDLFPG